MNSFFAKCEPYAPVILRLGISFVFFWFGFSQLHNAQPWAGLIPAWFSGLTGGAINAVHLNGIAEVVLAFLLVFNICTRWVALLLFLHLLSIVGVLGLNAVGIRDIGLSIACLALAVGGKKWQDVPAEGYFEQKSM